MASCKMVFSFLKDCIYYLFQLLSRYRSSFNDCFAAVFFFFQFPLCDGAHGKHNEETGDNVGPLVLRRKVDATAK